jgi:hypothetical protein
LLGLAALGLAGATAAGGCASEDVDGEGGSGGQGAAGGGTTTSSAETTAAGSTTSSTTVASTTGTTGSTASSTATATTTTAMNVCGNGEIETGETCEGTDFNGKTCLDFGFSGGDLICNPFCNVVVSQCTPKELCVDGQDNDFDGQVDCADDECATELSCTDPCSSPTVLNIPGFSFAQINGEPSVLSSSCSATSGPEAVFMVTAIADGDLTAQFSPFGFDGTISIRTVCNDVASEIACVNNNGTGQTENISIPATQGTTYFIIAEATTAASGGYDFSVDQPQPESFCDGQWDDDFDGFLDCDDPTNCKGQSPDCTPGPGGYGVACFDNNACNANDGDPICLGWQQGFNNGYCSEFCASNADCTNGTCVDLNISVHGVCLKNCSVPADCPLGTSCVDIGVGQTVCDKPPEISCQDWDDDDFDDFIDCEDPSACKGISPNCTSGPTAPGGPCQIHNQCSAGQGDPHCIQWPGGYCSEFCDMSADDCAPGSVCSGWMGFSSGNGTCMQECQSDTDCHPGFICLNDGNHDICVF